MFKSVLLIMLMSFITTPIFAEPKPTDTESIASKNLEESNKFFEKNKKKAEVKTLPSGLQYKVIKQGTGTSPGPQDFVHILYRGTLLDGTEFERSTEAPSTFQLSNLIPGWVEALQLMKVGAKWIIYVPANLAYGKTGVNAKIGPNAGLIFEIELVDVMAPPDNEETDVLEQKEN